MPSKVNRLSIHLIKQGIKAEDVVDSKRSPLAVSGVGSFYFEHSTPHRPDWLERFFGDAIDEDVHLFVSSAQGVLVVPITRNEEQRIFAISFGVGRYLLNDGVLEERFGLKVVLNSVDPESFRSIDKTTLGSVPKHSREQMSRDVSHSDFGIDIDQDLINSVTGRSRDEALGKTITGREALSLSVRANIGNIKPLLAHCLDRYESLDYRRDFDWIDQIADVRDKLLESDLNQLLVQRLNERNLEKLWMAVPDIIDWEDVKGFRYLKAHQADLHDDLNLTEFIKELDDKRVTVDLLRSSKVFMISAARDEASAHWPALKCIYAEVMLGAKLYILNSARWYEIAKDFSDQVQADFHAMPHSTLPLPDCEATDEGKYNEAAAELLPGACCMDRKMIVHGGGHNKIEFCDLYVDDRKLVHVKRYGGSSVLSHLFAQGVVSGELFIGDAAFREKLNETLPDGHKLVDPGKRPEAHDYEIAYAIISESKKDLDIPFFSKVSLRNARRRLATLGYQVTLTKIQRTAGVND